MAASTARNTHAVSDRDTVIAVMGATGVGKSSFINLAAGSHHAIIGHDLSSCTQGVQAVRCSHPDNPDRNVVFLDTPGFDDARKTDAEVLMAIAHWLNTTYEQGILLTGLLFLHRISDNRMTGTSVRNKHMFEMLCGIGALQNVILVTTMWDTVDELTGSEREKELRAKFWKSMIASGSQVARFDQTYLSAWQILRRFAGVGRPLRLQVEMVDEQKPLVQTAAGFALFQWLDHLLTHFRAMIATLRQRLRDTPTSPEITKDLLRETSTVQDNFNKAHEQKTLLVNEPIAEKRAYPQKLAEETNTASELATEAGSTSDQAEKQDKVQETASEERSMADRGPNIMTHEATHKVLNEGSADERTNGRESAALKRSKMAVERQAEEPLAEARACNKLPWENQERMDDEAERIVLVENRADENRQTKEIPLVLTDRADKRLELRHREESKVRLATDSLWRLFADPDNSRHATDLVVLVGCTRKSFEIIELWQKQKRFDHPLVEEIVERISQQAPGYYRAVHKSAETAHKGCSFARDAVDFCKRLIRAKDSVEALMEGLDNIKEVAKTAHEDSEEMYQQFKHIRVELFKIQKDIPSNAVGSFTDRDALYQFAQATDDLTALIGHVGSFVDWWGDVNMSLANLEGILPQVKVDSKSLFRTETVAERWNGVHQRYVWYQREISAVEDYYKNLADDLTCAKVRKIAESPQDKTTVLSAEEWRQGDEGKHLVAQNQLPGETRGFKLRIRKSLKKRRLAVENHRMISESVLGGDAQNIERPKPENIFEGNSHTGNKTPISVMRQRKASGIDRDAVLKALEKYAEKVEQTTDMGKDRGRR